MHEKSVIHYKPSVLWATTELGSPDLVSASTRLVHAGVVTSVAYHNTLQLPNESTLALL